MINTTLTQLDLGGNWNTKNCNKECVLAISCVLKNNEKWTANNIGTEGAIKISELLKINTTLTQLDLSGIEIQRIDKNEL